MGKGFMYLFNIIDWYSRKVIDYELSCTLEKGFVLRCLKRAFSRKGVHNLFLKISCLDNGEHYILLLNRSRQGRV
ncbi:hypothetical protein ACT8ZS_04975 [Paenibacillus sp. M.A.Huq-84]